MKKINYLKNEKWRPVVGYDELYEVSTLGRVRGALVKKKGHLGKKCGNIKHQSLSTTGYYNVMIWKNNNPRLIKVHRLVATAFIPNPENKRTINHINCNKTDNRLVNLEWMTYKENLQHARDNGRIPIVIGEDAFSSKLTNKDVIEIRILAEMGIRTNTMARLFEVHAATISGIITRKMWNHI